MTHSAETTCPYGFDRVVPNVSQCPVSKSKRLVVSFLVRVAALRLGRLWRGYWLGLAFLIDADTCFSSVEQILGPLAEVGIPGLGKIYLATDPKSVKGVLAARHEMIKGRGWQHERAVLGVGLLNADSESYQALRALTAGYFTSTESIAALTDRTKKTCADFLDRHPLTEGTDIRSFASQIALRLACERYISSDFVVTAAFERDVNAVLRTLDTGRLTSLLFPQPAQAWIIERLVGSARGRVRSAIKSAIKRATLQPRSTRTLIDHILEQDPLVGHETVCDLVMEAVFAGHETTALGLFWVLYELGREPHVYAAVQAERGDGSRRQQPVLFKAIMHGLRLHPPAWATFRSAIKDVTVNGQLIPAGANVLVSLFHVNRAAMDKPAMPFGGGARICVGQHIAMQDLSTIVRAITSRFDLSTQVYRVGHRFGFSLYPSGPLRLPLRVHGSQDLPAVPFIPLGHLLKLSVTILRSNVLTAMTTLMRDETLPPAMRVPVGITRGLRVRSFVLVRSRELIRELIRDADNNFGRGGPLVNDLPEIFGQWSALVNSAQDMRAFRHVRQPFIDANTARGSLQQLTPWTEEMGSRLASLQDGQPFALRAFMFDYAFTTVLAPALGSHPETIAEVRASIDGILTRASARVLRFAKGPMAIFDRPLWLALGRVERLIKRDIALSLAGDNPHESAFMRQLINDGYEPEVMLDVLKTMLFAGMETMGSVLTYTVFELHKNPGVRDQVYAEIMRVASSGEVTQDTLARLPKTQLLVKEVLRLYPVVWGLHRTVLRDSTLGPYRVFHNDLLATSLYAHQRDPKTWVQADTLSLERFASLGPDERRYTAPFSDYGRHVCPARMRAPLEMVSALVAMARAGFAPELVGTPKHLVGVTTSIEITANARFVK